MTSAINEAAAWSWRAAITREAVGYDALVRGGRLHYRTWSRGVGPLLLLVHGFRGHSRWWDWIAPSFADDYDVVAMDLSGMGDTAWRSSYDADCFALDILGLIEELAAGPAFIVGHSFGGGSLLRACAIDSQVAPRRIAHAIVVDSWLRLPGHPSPEAGPMGGTRHYPDFDTARARFRLSPPQPVAEDAMLDYLAGHSLRQVDDTWHWKFDPKLPLPGSHDNGTLLQRIATTTDIVYGEASSIVTRELAMACVAALQHGRGPFEIQAAGHHLMLDQPVALIAMLRSLLAARRR